MLDVSLMQLIPHPRLTNDFTALLGSARYAAVRSGVLPPLIRLSNLKRSARFYPII